MRWTTWRRANANSRDPVENEQSDVVVPMGQTDWQRELERRGVPEDFSLALAERALDHPAAPGSEAARALLDGMAIAFEVERSTREQLTRNLRGLREVERMMGAFSGELSKLDEVLGVLAAYVRRMRSSGAAEPDRTLH